MISEQTLLENNENWLSLVYDGDSLFGVSGLIMENGISSISWNPFYSNPQSPGNGDQDAIDTIRENHSDQDYDVKTENNVLPNMTSLTKTHHPAEFSDHPFPASDGVLFSPPDFYKDDTPIGFRSTSAAGTRSEETDIFQPFKEKADTDVTHSSSANQNAESWPSSNQRDPLLEFILSRGKNFPAPPSETISVLQETSTKADGFLKTPSVSTSPFVSNTNDIFKTSSSSAGSKVPDIQSFDPLFAPQDEVQCTQKSADLLFTRQEDAAASHGQETPALATPSTSISNGDLMFRRRPPRAAPRSKPPKHLLQPPALSQITSPVVERDPLVYEDVLLIGQENCVEDWPEHSPELSPEWKPAGKLRLRRDSVRISDASDGGGDGHLKKNGKQTLGRKLRHSLLIRRSSKDKTGDEVKSSETNTHSLNRGSKLINGTDKFFAPDEEEQNEAAEYKSKKPSKPKIITHRRGSKVKSAEASDYKDDLTSSWKHADLEALREKKADDVDCKPKQPHKFKPPVAHLPSKENFAVGLKSMNGPPLMESKTAEIDTHPDDEERNAEETDGQKSKKKVRVKFVPHRGFVIGLSRVDKANNKTKEEIPHLKGDEGFDDLKGAIGYDFKGDTLLKAEAGQSYSPNHVQSPYFNDFTSPAWDSKADLETDVHKASDLFTASDASERHQKKSIKFKVLRLHRRQSKSFEDPEIKQSKDSEMKRPPLLQVRPLSPRDSKISEDSELPQKGADLFKAGDVELAEEYTPDNKPQKPTEPEAHRRGSKTKDIKEFPEDFLEPPGAVSGDFHLSDAAEAEWLSAQMDMRRLKDQEEEQKQEEEDDEGDTDSLMEWWNTVESWDEIPPDETIRTKEEETTSFKVVADKVHRGLRVYLKLFMERAELLYQHVLILYGIADDLSNFHHRAKIANITGGTTTAVGGAAAIAGLALIPVTFGASIIISAIGLGVATAGGITAASASISDTINNMHDRKKIEIIIMDYEAQLVEMQHCLRFVIEGLCRLRSHPLLRRNNYYTGDWEVRRALQTISLVSDPVDRAEELIHRTLAKLASLQKGIDKYFTKDSKEVKKGCKKEVTAEVRILAKQLHEGLAELNSIREQLLDASGNI
ncbi:uncharacterized protein LOC109054324 [Cyprinus carpio]|uniref:Uncharacterized protein LOC109054324 n=1 Tax=Cyprinus carpio TaxID=7962 RepID=A0A9Q9Y7R8_CYPCA|nr:uncharacterized protein LOC109054324 [Cyprinus carpio]